MNHSFRRGVAAVALAAGTALAITTIPAHASATVATQKATSTFIAAGGSLRGHALYKPACRQRFDCALSGDSTAFLYRMSWRTWTTSKAVGSGTYLLNDCTPSCAAGRFYKVPIVVTFTKPVRACFGKTVRWYWTRASFRYPTGLPPALRGANAPVNPWNFTGLAREAAASCHR